MDLTNRKVKMFRCHIDPNIPPRAQQAFMLGEAAGQTPGEAYLTPLGVYAKIRVKDKEQKDYFREFLVPLANLENIEFHPEEATTAKKLKPA